jgi:hypothetical protein
MGAIAAIPNREFQAVYGAFWSHAYWRIDDVVIVHPRDLRPWDQVIVYIEPLVDRWLDGPVTRSALVQLLRETSAVATGLPRLSPQEQRASIRAAILGAFRRGETAAIQRERTWRSPVDAAENARTQSELRSKPDAAKKAGKTWIEIRLVDQDGEPVAGAAYRLRITDGSVREGKLGAEGSVRVPGLEPGTCEVSFPEFDAGAWRSI